MPDNENLLDVSKKEIFATLPYFKGDTYEERLAIVSRGKELKGSLEDNYYHRAGTHDDPDRFLFEENGFGHSVEIIRLYEGDIIDFNVIIRDQASQRIVLDKAITHGNTLEGSMESSKEKRWWL